MDNCNYQPCPFDKEEWGSIKQQVAETHEAIRGEFGVLAQLKIANGRVRTLEINQAKIMAGAAVVAFLVGLAVKFM